MEGTEEFYFGYNGKHSCFKCNHVPVSPSGKPAYDQLTPITREEYEMPLDLLRDKYPWVGAGNK